MLKSNNAVVLEIASAIRDYLATHPNAADSMEGITTWWLARQRYEYAMEAVEQALQQLEASGLVRKQQGSDGRWLYASAGKTGDKRLSGSGETGPSGKTGRQES